MCESEQKLEPEPCSWKKELWSCGIFNTAPQPRLSPLSLLLHIDRLQNF